MSSLIKILAKLGLLKDDLDYHSFAHRWSSYFCFLVYQKCLDYERRHWFLHDDWLREALDPLECAARVPTSSNFRPLGWRAPKLKLNSGGDFLWHVIKRKNWRLARACNLCTMAMSWVWARVPRRPMPFAF